MHTLTGPHSSLRFPNHRQPSSIYPLRHRNHRQSPPVTASNTHRPPRNNHQSSYSSFSQTTVNIFEHNVKLFDYNSISDALSSLKRLDVYKGVEKGKEPKFRKKFAAIEKLDYQAPADDKWRHDNSDSGTETEKMQPFEPKKTRWWVKTDDKKKKRTPKAATPKAGPKRALKKKKSPPHLVDEPDDVPPENIDVNVAGGDHEIFLDEIENIIADQDALKVAEKAGGEKGGKNIEAMKETLVEGDVHTDSSDTESDTYDSAAETEKLKKRKGLQKRKAQPTGEIPRRRKVRKTTADIPEQIPEVERVENVEMEVPVQSECRMVTPPASPIHESIPEVNVTTPQQPPKTVEEPRSTTKKIPSPSPTPQGSSQGFPKVPSNLDGGPTSLDDVGYIPFFNGDKVDELAKKVGELEKAKADTDAELKVTKEKRKQVEAENVVLKNEMLAMNDQIEDVKAGNNALNEMIDELLVTNCDLNDANTTMSNANEILQKEIEDLKADKENKSKQIEMLYAVIEDRLGINVHAAYDDVEIRRAEALRMEKEQQNAAEAAKDKGKGIAVEEASEEVLESSSQREQQQPEDEANDDNALVLAQQFVLVGKAKSVSYSREDNARRIEVERRRLKAKQEKKDQTVEKVDEENDDLKDIEVDNLRHKYEIYEAEIKKSRKQVQEAMELAADESAKFKAAKDAIEILTSQLKDIAKRLAPGSYNLDSIKIPNGLESGSMLQNLDTNGDILSTRISNEDDGYSDYGDGGSGVDLGNKYLPDHVSSQVRGVQN
ncbi:putative transcription factor BREVIS RADIX domain-containing protein [Helianthus annuus]|nr:putative transcription factor BREVIS RADIX domain-containing protein [Helianthus annuus]